jgi:multiple sugar transport system permease protein
LRKGLNRIIYYVVTVVVLLVLGAYFILPLWWLFVSSTKSYGTIFSHNQLLFFMPSLNSYSAALFGPYKVIFPVLRWLENSMVTAIGAGVIGSFFAAMAGYSLAKFKFRGRNILMLVVVVALLIPSVALAFPQYLLEQNIGLENSWWAIIFPSAVSAFGVYFMEIYAEDTIPKEILEAARLDGASELRIFRSIVLRYFKPALITVFVIIFGATWNVFFLPLFVERSTTWYTLPQGLTDVVTLGSGNIAIEYEILFASSVLAIIPLVIIVLTLERYIESGLGLGAVKA